MYKRQWIPKTIKRYRFFIAKLFLSALFLVRMLACAFVCFFNWTNNFRYVCIVPDTFYFPRVIFHKLGCSYSSQQFPINLSTLEVFHFEKEMGGMCIVESVKVFFFFIFNFPMKTSNVYNGFHSKPETWKLLLALLL